MTLFGRIWTTFSPFKSSPFPNPKPANGGRRTLEPLTPSSRKRRNDFDEEEPEAATTSKKRRLLEQDEVPLIKLEPRDSPLIAKTKRSLTPAGLIKKLVLKEGSPGSVTPDLFGSKDGSSSSPPSNVLESVERDGNYYHDPMTTDEQSDSPEDDDDDVVQYSDVGSDETLNSSMKDGSDGYSIASSNGTSQDEPSSLLPAEEDDTNEATILDESTLDAKDTKIKVATGLYNTPRLHVMEQERARRKRNAERLTGWSAADKALSYKIAMRGLEPLIPANWHCEFPVFMPKLFARGAQKAFIDVSGRHRHRTDDFWAMRYLTKLMELGPRVRDKLRADLPPEKIMKRVFEDYIFWSLRDADVVTRKGRLPMIEVVAGSKDATTTSLQNRLARKLRALAGRWRNALANPNDPIPPLYGIIVTYGVVCIASYVPEGTGRCSKTDPANCLRSIGIFDYKDGKHDVWNGFAVAITVIHSRNVLLELLDGGKVKGYDGTDDVGKENDPDI
ncbi:MAG: hypothetical protein M1831_003534 [Alyxoria varia]|nr:MAG: hypothetical protein M1831_003534 [Alyxoria varia]